MTDLPAAEDFAKLEKLYTENPKAYKRKVLRLVMQGYGSILFAVVLLLGLVVGGAILILTGNLYLHLLDNYIKMALPASIAVVLMSKALFVKVPPPEGSYLDGKLKKRVLEVFEEMRQKVGGVKIDEVLIVNELNAAVMQRQKFGMVGPATNYLILGLPLLQLLNAQEARFVLAHEFGHLSHDHGRLSSTVYRLNHTLAAISETLKEKARHGKKTMADRFYERFGPKFNRVTFAMRRGQEYEADNAAVAATSATALASALCKLDAYQSALDNYWMSVWERARQHSDNGPVSPLRDMRNALSSQYDNAAGAAAVQAAMERDTDYHDSHPCMRDRLGAHQIQPVLEFQEGRSALDELFSADERDQLLALGDAYWRESSRENWQQAHLNYKEAEADMQQLNENRASLEGNDLLRLARLQENLGDPETALKTFGLLVGRHADSAVAHYHWGRVNIERDLGMAQNALLQSLTLDIDVLPDVVRLLDYGRKHAGLEESRAELQPFIDQYRKKCDLANEERDSIAIEDELRAVELDEDTAASIGNFLCEQFPEIRRLFLVEKPVRTFADDRFFLLAYEIRLLHHNIEADVEVWRDRVTGLLNAEFPFLNTAISLVVDKGSAWRGRLSGLDGALIYTQKISWLRRSWISIRIIYWLSLVILIIYLIYSMIFRN